MSVIFIYVTVPSRDIATQIAERVVTDRLAACVNVMAGMQSVYIWDGVLQTSEETAMIIKSRESLFPAVADIVRKLHPHDTPCIVSLNVAAGEAGYLDWLLNATKP